MSEYEIPFHIQEEIMKRLPVKSLIQFRSVSKTWKSLIDSSEFIAAHSLRSHTQPQHLLLSWEEQKDEVNYACYIDDDAFPNQRPVRTSPLSAKQLVPPRVIGSSQGLLCLYDGGTDPNPKKMAVVWNPSIRKSIVVVVPDTPFVGFGVCHVTGDPKIVSITQYWDKANTETSYRCEVMVYTLSSGKWRSLSGNLPTKRIQDWLLGVAADGFIYWRAGSRTHNCIMSFDVTNETFEVIDLPDTLACVNPFYLRIYKLRESLAILQFDSGTYTVWIMEGGVQRSFTKLFTMLEPPLGFRKTGVPIMLATDDELAKLVVYEPNSEHNNVLEFSGNAELVDVNPYMETLLLLGRSDCTSY